MNVYWCILVKFECAFGIKTGLWSMNLFPLLGCCQLDVSLQVFAEFDMCHFTNYF